MIDKHHIYEKGFVKKKGKYPDWIHSPINLVEVEHWNHINNIDRKNTSKKGMEAKAELYKRLVDRINWQYINGLIDAEERTTLDQVYYWCTVLNFNKASKDHELLKAYEIICTKYMQVQGQEWQ